MLLILFLVETGWQGTSNTDTAFCCWY